MPARVRWGNVGRAAGVVALVALVVAWPRLGAPAVKLPRDAALPVAGESGAHAAPARPVREADPRGVCCARRGAGGSRP